MRLCSAVMSSLSSVSLPPKSSLTAVYLRPCFMAHSALKRKRTSDSSAQLIWSGGRQRSPPPDDCVRPSERSWRGTGSPTTSSANADSSARRPLRADANLRPDKSAFVACCLGIVSDPPSQTGSIAAGRCAGTIGKSEAQRWCSGSLREMFFILGGLGCQEGIDIHSARLHSDGELVRA
jgi:hypothetical protein